MEEERGSEKQDSCMVLRFGRTSSTDIVAVLGFAELTVTTRRAGMYIVSPFLVSRPRIIYLNCIYCFSLSTSLNPLLIHLVTFFYPDRHILYQVCFFWLPFSFLMISTFHRINQMDLHRRPQRWFFYAHTCLTMYFASCGGGAIRFCSGTCNTMRNCGHLGKSTCRTGSISDGRCVLYERTRYLASRGAGHPRCMVCRPLTSIFHVSHYFPFFNDFSDFYLFQLFSVL